MAAPNGEGFSDIGDLQLVLLNQDFTEGMQGSSEGNGDYTSIGELIPYREANWLQRTGASRYM